MKNPILLCTALLAGLQLATAADFKTFPSYVLEAYDSEDQLHPVVGVAENGIPLIVMNREIQQSPKNNVKVRPTDSINNVSVTVGPVKEDRTDNGLVLETEVSCSQEIEDVYAVLVYTPEGKEKPACRYTRVGTLTGDPRDLTLRFKARNLPDSGWSLHFFQSGMELYDTGNPELKEASPRQAFTLALTRHMAGAGSGNANPAPFFMPIPMPDPSLLPEGDGPVLIKVRMEILANGTVDNFMFPDDVSPELQVFLTKRLGEWLFLPRIKDGKRVDQAVVLPVKLR